MIKLPVGVLTFLFTDIEGSTKRWEHAPEAMRAALARHDAIMRAAIEAHGGVVYKTIGDAFCAVFPSPQEALAAAVAAQQGILAEAWDPQLGGLRVRMGIHTGHPERRGAEYFGQPVNRVSRLMSVGHGGQILISAASVAQLGTDLPDGVALRDLGERRLKDLLRPEHIYQLNAPGLPDQFPPLTTLDQRPNNLPFAPTPLLGREREEATVRDLLLRPDVRLVTLLGPGGMGKTRLSLQLAADLSDDFADGLYFIALAAVTEGEFVVSTIAQTLGVHEVPGQTLRESLREFVRAKQLLLVLDNLEQVIGPAAPVVADMLEAGPRVKMLATSRIPLHTPGEREYAVPPLALPNPRRMPPLEVLVEYPAVQLFTQRAVAAKHDFELTTQNAPAVAQICALLDGLPLAIELAAARITMLPPAALLQRLVPKGQGGLAGRLRILSGGARDLPTRQQTITNTIAFSYDLLDDAEQALFRRLAVFVDGWTPDEAANIVASATSLALDIDAGLASLADKSLIVRSGAMNGTSATGPRFGMLQVIREFGLGRLDAAGEGESLRHAHAHFFARFADSAESLPAAEQMTWQQRLETEHDNLRAALAWARDERQVQFGMSLVATMCRFWFALGYLTEGRRWIEEFLALDTGEAVPDDRATVLFYLGGVSMSQGDHAAAERYMEQSLAISRETGNTRQAGIALNGLGSSALWRGDFARAEQYYAEALALWRTMGDERLVPMVLNNLGLAVQRQGDLDRALPYLRESVDRARAAGDTANVAIALLSLSQVDLARGDAAEATRHAREGLRMVWELGHQFEVALALEYLAEARTALGEDDAAARIFGMSNAVYEDIGAQRADDDLPGYDAAVAHLRERMGAEAFTAAEAAGRAADREREVPALCDDPA